MVGWLARAGSGFSAHATRIGCRDVNRADRLCRLQALCKQSSSIRQGIAEPYGNSQCQCRGGAMAGPASGQGEKPASLCRAAGHGNPFADGDALADAINVFYEAICRHNPWYWYWYWCVCECVENAGCSGGLKTIFQLFLSKSKCGARVFWVVFGNKSNFHTYLLRGRPM